MQRSRRNAAEYNCFGNTSRHCDILLVQRRQQPERLLASAQVFVCLCVSSSSIILSHARTLQIN